MKKQFKIGEYAVGGIIAVELTGKVLKISALDYNSKKEVSSGTVITQDFGARNTVYNYLNELTSSYYADKVMIYIQTQTILN